MERAGMDMGAWTGGTDGRGGMEWGHGRAPPRGVLKPCDFKLPLELITVTIIIIRTTNFGWAHPNRVLSQAVFQKFAAGHPKFGAEREVRASTWGLALTASRLDAPRVPKKNSKKLIKKLIKKS
jgi:hypothetical protein